MNLLTKQKYSHRGRKQTSKKKWRGRGGVMNWEIGIDIYTLYKKKKRKKILKK